MASYSLRLVIATCTGYGLDSSWGWDETDSSVQVMPLDQRTTKPSLDYVDRIVVSREG
jgi:hypothetical protein